MWKNIFVNNNNNIKGAWLRNFRQFQHWSSGHRINWNIITAQNYRRTQTKHRKAKKGQGWTKLGTIEMDFIWVNLKNVGPPFFKFISVYIKMSFKQLENHSQLLWPWFWKRKTLALPIWRLELITNKIKQNYLKQRDLASLNVNEYKLEWILHHLAYL